MCLQVGEAKPAAVTADVVINTAGADFHHRCMIKPSDPCLPSPHSCHADSICMLCVSRLFGCIKPPAQSQRQGLDALGWSGTESCACHLPQGIEWCMLTMPLDTPAASDFDRA